MLLSPIDILDKARLACPTCHSGGETGPTVMVSIQKIWNAPEIEVSKQWIAKARNDLLNVDGK